MLLVGGAMSLRVYQTYREYYDSRAIFSKYYSELDKKEVQREHIQQYKMKISTQGYPDDGNWILSKLLSTEDWLKLNSKKKLYEKQN